MDEAPFGEEHSRASRSGEEGRVLGLCFGSWDSPHSRQGVGSAVPDLEWGAGSDRRAGRGAAEKGKLAWLGPPDFLGAQCGPPAPGWGGLTTLFS